MDRNILEIVLAVNMFFDVRQYELRVNGLDDKEYAQREEELSHARKAINKLMQVHLSQK